MHGKGENTPGFNTTLVIYAGDAWSMHLLRKQHFLEGVYTRVGVHIMTQLNHTRDKYKTHVIHEFESGIIMDT